MFHLHRSNRVERLADALADVLRTPVGSPVDREWIAVQSQGMETWLAMQLARRLGIWANPWFPFPRALFDALFDAVLGEAEQQRAIWGIDRLSWAIAGELPALLPRPAFEPLRAYLADDPRGTRLHGLCRRVAHTLDQYAVYRPGWMLRWGEQPGDGWQGQLVHALVERHGAGHAAAVADRFQRALADGAFDPARLPPRLSLFGITALPPMQLRLLAALPDTVEVHLLLTSPAPAAWEAIHERADALAPRLDDAPDELDAELARDAGHPLLAALGRAGRETQLLLEVLGPRGLVDHDWTDPPAGEPATALSALQADLFAGRRRGPDGAAPPLALDPGDGSLAIHTCHAPMREVEVLHDQLRALFDDDATLQPSDVIVMSPDIEAYTPYIDAVFGARAAGREPPIPYAVSDRSERRETPVADALLALLALPRSRVTASEILDLLALDAVRRRLALTGDELERIARWIRAAGVRWGIDAAHRAAWDQPARVENTWRFGLDRLLLGHAIPDESLFGDTLPYPEIEGQDAALLGRLVAFVEGLFEALDGLDEPRPLSAWADDLQALLQRTLHADRETEHQHQRIRDALAELARGERDTGFDEPVDLDVIRELLARRFDDTRSTRGFLTGGVTLCNLVPMRSIPFRVVCLLGMNDADFPRSQRAPGFDAMAQQPRAGDRVARTDDRYLFLEALLAARERLLITHVGRDVRDNAPLPPSVVVAELLDAVDEGFVADADRCVLAHPLQPFSPRYFGADADPRLFSYAAGYCDGARAAQGERAELPPFLDGPLPAPEADADPPTLPLEALVAFVQAPSGYLLQRRLGVRPRPDPRAPDDREPVALDPLAAYQVRGTLVERFLDGDDDETAWRRIRAEGVLPLGTPGRCRYDELAREMTPFAAELRAAIAGTPRDPVDVDLALSGARLVGRVGDLWPGGRVRHTAARASAKALLELWIHHLALAAHGGPTAGLPGVLLTRGGDGVERHELAPLPADDARARLDELIALFRHGEREPLRLFPRSAMAYAAALAAHDGDDERAMRAARGEWETAWNGREGEGQDPAVVRLWGGSDPLEEPAGEGLDFRALARRVFTPLLAAEVAR